jgi:RimJ/RimL family protein N-acetyltransferase
MLTRFIGAILVVEWRSAQVYDLRAPMSSAMATLPLPLLTARLVIRPFEMDDLEELHAIMSRADIVRYVPWEPRDREAVSSVLAARVGGEQEGLSLAVVLGPDGPLIGDISLFGLVPEQRIAEIGFIFHPDHHGRGLASEAVAAVVGAAFAHLGLHRIVGRCDARNVPSIRLMERIGMRMEAHLIENEYLKGEWTDELDFAVLAREWSAARSAEAS